MLTLSEIPKGRPAVIQEIQNHSPKGQDIVAQRLQELGFLPGEVITITAYAPWKDPILVEIANTQFALRRSEAARILVLIIS